MKQPDRQQWIGHLSFRRLDWGLSTLHQRADRRARLNGPRRSAGPIGDDLHQVAIEQVATEGQEVGLDASLLGILLGEDAGGFAHARGLIQNLKHVSAGGIEPVVHARFEVEHDGLGHEAAMHDMLRKPKPGAEEGFTIDGPRPSLIGHFEDNVTMVGRKRC